jgi:hypothetical protein
MGLCISETRMVVLGVAATNVAATCSVPPYTADVQ